MKLNVVIIDDEENARKVLRDKLEKNCPEVNILLESGDLIPSINFINSTPLDAIFLDIQMPEMSGFEFIQELKNFSGEIIFVTAFDQFAIKAFEVFAFGYLLKPISTKLLVETVEKLKERKQNSELDHSMTRRLEELIKSKTYGLNKMSIPTANGYHFIDFEEIIRLQGASKYTVIYTKDKEFVSTKNIGFFKDVLPQKEFFQSHKSHIINIAFISSFNVDGEILLKNDVAVPLSRRRKSALLDMFL